MIKTDGSNLVETQADYEHPRKTLERMDKELLRPCPFCGRKPLIYVCDYGRDVQISCNCDLHPRTGRFNSQDRFHHVTVEWNQRA